MVTQFNSRKQTKTADEIIDNAIGLPLENQEILLMMAKAMQYTHNCVLHQNTGRSPAPESDT